MYDIKDQKLENGLRLVTIETKGGLMSMQLGFDSGAYEDAPGKKGTAHFLEHMVFTGTKDFSHEELNEYIDDLAGEVNAYTDTESTVYSISALNEELDHGLYLLSQMVTATNLTQKELNRERQVILSEYRDGLEDLENQSFYKLFERAWPQDPLHLRVIGSKESIEAITLEDLERYQSSYYVPGAAVLVLASAYSHQTMKERVQHYFSAWPAKERPAHRRPKVAQVGGIFEEINEASDLATFSLVQTFQLNNRREQLAMQIMNHRLGSSNNSLLFKEIRLLRGLSYDVYSSLNLDHDFMDLEIYCATAPEHLKEVREIILSTLKDLREGTICLTEKDLKRSRKVHKTGIAETLDHTEGLTSEVLYNALLGRSLLPFEEEAKIIDSLTLEEVTQTFQKVLTNPTVLLFEPALEEEGLNKSEQEQAELEKGSLK